MLVPAAALPPAGLYTLCPALGVLIIMLLLGGAATVSALTGMISGLHCLARAQHGGKRHFRQGSVPESGLFMADARAVAGRPGLALRRLALRRLALRRHPPLRLNVTT
jgi:hypothetical protein